MSPISLGLEVMCLEGAPALAGQGVTEHSDWEVYGERFGCLMANAQLSEIESSLQ
jgi:hypothetical protein